MMIHKDTFFQNYNGECGIPNHWVVQYWDNNPYGFPISQYFDTCEKALEFEKTLLSFENWEMAQ